MDARARCYDDFLTFIECIEGGKLFFGLRRRTSTKWNSRLQVAQRNMNWKIESKAGNKRVHGCTVHVYILVYSYIFYAWIIFSETEMKEFPWNDSEAPPFILWSRSGPIHKCDCWGRIKNIHLPELTVTSMESRTNLKRGAPCINHKWD